MVRPVSFKGFQKGFQGVSLRGFRGFQIFLWELCVCIKYLSLGDPCMGSGHILCVFFDVLVRIYEDYGYTAREAAVKIVENNLWGLDIDERAAQLAYFAVMMKARQYDRRFFSRGIQPHVYAIRESNGISRAHLQFLGRGLSDLERNNAVNQMNGLLDEFVDAGEYGSLLQPKAYDWALLSRFVEDTTPSQQISFEEAGLDDSQAQMRRMIIQGQVLAQKYHAVVTNPPYMGSSGMNEKLSAFVKANYPETKSDMSTVCMEKTLSMCMPNGFMAMINIPVWMFLSSYEKLRNNLITHNIIVNMVHPGRGIFGSDFGTTSFVIAKKYISGYKGSYARLFEQQGEVKSIEEREETFLTGKNRFVAQQDNFTKIPGAPVAYWVSEVLLRSFDGNELMRSFAPPKQGSTLGDNKTFLRMWFEVARNKNDGKWRPCVKGGEYRKWYGNHYYLVNWEDNGKAVRSTGRATIRNSDYLFREGIHWSRITSGLNSFRHMEEGFFFESAAGVCFPCYNDIKYTLGLLNSSIVKVFAAALNPTLTLQSGDVANIPVAIGCRTEVNSIVDENITLSRLDWDSFETSWDFMTHPLIRLSKNLCYDTSISFSMRNYYEEFLSSSCPLETCYMLWQGECKKRFETLKANEEKLNRIFISLYGLQDELTPEVEDKNITVRLADKTRDIKSLISYAVGCMFGRYSIYKPGLLFAGEHYSLRAFIDKLNDQPGTVSEKEVIRAYRQEGVILNEILDPDRDNIIPISDEEYFNDDITDRFVRFIEEVYGRDTLDKNLRFIADALGGSGAPLDIIRNYFLNGFYIDHLKVYQKRPIYWLFDSGKNNGFKCLIYMHRYQPDIIARIRTDYVHEQQSRYRTAIEDVERRMRNTSTSDRVKLGKRLSALQAQAEELRLYEEKMHHLADQMIAIDLDDGVKVNYAKFQDVLAKIR
ncbi:MAG: BREX-1 system adenine-specific DNA-methyltransferase PglX [Candidatus Excrementavichristensenella sp.]|jgi:hypothetical protein